MAEFPAWALLVGNDCTLEVNGLKNGLTGDFVNEATVVATLADMQDVPVGGQTWPVVVDYVTGSQGCYRVILQNTLAIQPGKHYTLTVGAQGDGLTAVWQMVLPAKIRRL